MRHDHIRWLGIGFIAMVVCACSSAPPAAAPAAPAVSATPQASTAQPVTIKGMTQLLATDAPLLIARDRGYFQEQGLDVQLQVINDGATAIAPLSTGQLDFAVGAVGVALFNAISRGTGVKVVGDKGQNSPDPSNGFSGLNWFVVSKSQEGTIKTAADLRGKKIAISDPNSTTALVLDQLLATGGLTTQDVDVVQLGFPDMVAALANHAVDAALENEPFASQGVANGSLVKILNTGTLRPGDQNAVILFGPSMEKLGPDVGTRWMIAYTRAIRTYLDAFGPKSKDRDAMIDILANATTVKDKSLYAQMSLPYFNGDCKFNTESISAAEEFYFSKGLLQTKPDLRQAIDTSYCENAVKQLGPYS